MTLLRHVEIGARLHVLLTIVKVREQCITGTGLVVQPLAGAAGKVLSASSMYPMQSHRGGTRRP